MKAVILAAGMGTRLRPLTNKIPKSLILLEGKPLIKYSLDNIRDAGISDAVIVTGFMEDMFKRELGKCYNGIDIQYISNHEYEKTGSMYSLSKTERRLDDDIILLESDLLYEPRAIKELLNSPYPDVILVAPISGSGDEVFIYFDKSGYLKDLGKSIKHEIKGELAGITKLSRKLLKELYETAREDYKIGEINYHYEETMFKLSKKYPIKCLFIEDLTWIEIDKKEDLKKGRRIIFPKINTRHKNDNNCRKKDST